METKRTANKSFAGSTRYENTVGNKLYPTIFGNIQRRVYSSEWRNVLIVHLKESKD